MSSLLPLFPLDVVLLPGAPFPLHIFEPRYKEMISECIALHQTFGVVRVKEEGVASIGCTAEIITVAKKYDDGRMDILTQGRRRFEILELDQERSFLRAEVLFVDDDPGHATTEEIARASGLHGEIIKLAGAEPLSDELDPEQASYHLAASLPLDLDFKQTLLAMKAEPERIQAVIAAFESLLPRLQRTVQARKTAGGNGHVH